MDPLKNLIAQLEKKGKVNFARTLSPVIEGINNVGVAWLVLMYILFKKDKWIEIMKETNPCSCVLIIIHVLIRKGERNNMGHSR